MEQVSVPKLLVIDIQWSGEKNYAGDIVEIVLFIIHDSRITRFQNWIL